MIPPTIRIGAEMITVSAMNTSVWTCWTSFVLRVMSDAGPKLVDLDLREASRPCAKIALRTSRPKPIATAGPEVDRERPTAIAEDEGDDEHQRAGPEDVVGVALGDAVVDDVGVEVRQVQVADRLDEQQDHDQDELAGIGPQVGPEEADHRGASGAGVVASAAGEPAGLSAIARWAAAAARALRIARVPAR